LPYKVPRRQKERVLRKKKKRGKGLWDFGYSILGIISHRQHEKSGGRKQSKTNKIEEERKKFPSVTRTTEGKAKGRTLFKPGGELQRDGQGGFT